jgi:hypothetical protein
LVIVSAVSTDRDYPAHLPQEPGLPVHWGAGSSTPPLEAKTESFFSILREPQCGQVVPFQLVERTRTSLSLSQSEQWNS